MMTAVENGHLAAFNVASVSFEYGMTLADIERAVILETLKQQNNNRTRAARVLGIGIRTLQRKLKQYNSQLALTEYVNA